MKTNVAPEVKRILRILLAILIITLLVMVQYTKTSAPSQIETTPHVSETPSPIPTPPTPEFNLFQDTDQTIRLAWFYKPPQNGLLSTLAQNYHLFILTHKDKEERDTLRSLGVESPILLYLQLLEIKDPGSCTSSPQGNQVAYQPGDFCEISERHPDWFLLDQNGNRIITNDSVYMDPGHPEYRAFWLERARALQEQYHWDGFFIDNLEASLSKITARGIVPAKYPDDASYQAAVEGFLKYLRDNYFKPHKQPVVANIISIKDWNVWLHYLQYLDGAMIESFAVGWNHDYRSVSDWEGQLAAIDQALVRGKSLILVSQAKEPDEIRQRFALASYLLIANDYTSFRYADADGYREVFLYENYSLKLGKPLGPRYKEGDSWRRDFSNGSVLANPGTHEAEIKLNP